ncbi:VanZ family protein [Bacillus sp. SJS]|uniref:VanZ family protein n=1 Tax=Bacillus sp. SJS TaxID=1423321 RepID=UPI0004DD549B|nr:VanZ family protein [Bacillus sp. SJS]KZZ82673.1 hypothetical protein AS29_017835 [Bacillus sp. SJS]
MIRLLEPLYIFVVPLLLTYVILRLMLIQKFRIKWKIECIRIVFITYIIYLLYFVWIIPAPQFNYLSINFIPFKTIIEYIRSALNSSIPTKVVITNLIGNILLTLPLGFLLPLYSKKINWKKIFFISLLLPIAIEVGQFFLFYLKLGSRGIDIDDVVLNFIGLIIGYSFFNWINKKFRNFQI